MSAPKKTVNGAVFFHIGKTGGTSLSAKLALSAPGESYIQSRSDDFAIFDNVRSLQDYAFVAGHFPIKPYRHLLSKKWITFTLLRNPVAHLLSQYWHVRNQRERGVDPGHQQGNAAADPIIHFDVHEFLSSNLAPRDVELFDNPQTRAILGIRTARLSSRHAEAAIRELERLSATGVTEELELFSRQLEPLLSWPKLATADEAPRVMVNPRSIDGIRTLSRRSLVEITRLTELDAAVYDHVFAASERRRMSAAAPRSKIRKVPAGLLETPISDLVRTGSYGLTSAVEGQDFMILGDVLSLHPPPVGEAAAELRLIELDLKGHNGLSGQAYIDNPHSQPVTFGIAVHCNAALVSETFFTVASGAGTRFSLRFPASFGKGELRLTTRMADGMTSNAYAWAKFGQAKLTRG